MTGTARGIRLKFDSLKKGLIDSKKSNGITAAPSQLQLLVPLIGKVAAGSPILAQEHVEQTYALAPSMFSERPDYLLKVRGMSMRDAGILEGDLLAVHHTTEAQNGQIIVARIDNEVTVKRFKQQRKKITLLPENPAFEPIEVANNDTSFAIEGRVIGLIRASGF
jgi:repressor LexA